MTLDEKQIEPTQFTECVSNASGQQRASEDSLEMVKRLQGLIEQIQIQPNPSVRALLQECLQSLLSFYGEGIGRILKHLRESGEGGRSVLERMLHDKSISGLLLIHGLHPL